MQTWYKPHSYAHFCLQLLLGITNQQGSVLTACAGANQSTEAQTAKTMTYYIRVVITRIKTVHVLLECFFARIKVCNRIL